MKKSLILPLVATAALGMSAAAPSGHVPGAVKIPAGHERFEAPMQPRTLPSLSGGISELKTRIAEAPVPGPVRVAPSFAPAAGAGTIIYGYLGNTNISGKEYGFYSVDPYKGGTFMWQDELTSLSWQVYTGWYRDGKVCGLTGIKFQGSFMAYAYTEFDFASGLVVSHDYIDLAQTGMYPVFLSSAYRTLDDKVYGYGYDETGEGFSFSVADGDGFANPRSLTIVDIADFCTAMCYDSQADVFYGITTTGKFVEIDCEGTQTEICTINLPNIQANVMTGMTYVPSLNSVIWDPYFADVTTGFYAINMDTKEVSLLSKSRGAEIYSFLLNTEDNANPKAPAIARLDSYEFTGTSLDGSLTYTLPGKTQDDSPLAGNLDWKLLVDGNEWESGTAPAGSQITVPVTSIENGHRTFSLITAKDNLNSVACILNKWIGSDTPSAPANAKLTETTVTWDAPTTSVHNGYVDFADITYTVKLNDKVIGTTKNTSLGYTLPQGKPFTSYTAEVTASFDDKTSEAAVSNFITYGDPLECPVHFRPEEKELELMTLINVDGHKFEDGRDDTWRFIMDMGFPAFASGYNGDDWLILPPMNLSNTSKAYRFEMEIGLVHDMDTSGTYEVCIGTSPTAEAMTRVIIPTSHCEHMRGDILEEFFAVSEPGTYYIGIHTVTNKVSFHVSDIDVSLSSRDADVPTGVTDLQAVAGEEGALNATVSFKMPEYTADGRKIDPSTVITANVESYSINPEKPNTPAVYVASASVTGAPGSVQSVVVNTAQNYNNITVTCVIDGRAGKGETTMIYTGVVLPYIVQDLKGTISEDNMSVELTWTPPVQGQEPGVIGDSFRYLIYYYGDGWQYGDDAGVDVLHYTYTLKPGAELQHVRLGVMAYNAAGLSDYIQGATFSIGTPIQLPWVDDLTTPQSYENMNIVRPNEQYENTWWLGDDPATISPIFANESKMAMIGYTVGYTNVKGLVSLPKVSTRDYSAAKLVFNYWDGVAAAKMRILGKTFGMEERMLLSELPCEGKGWRSYTIELPEQLLNRGWIELYVEADIADEQTYAMFSGYSITGTSGVSDVAVSNEGKITTGPGSLTLSGFSGESLIVSDIAGRAVVTARSLDDVNTYCLAPGTYIVRAGGKAAKVVIR